MERRYFQGHPLVAGVPRGPDICRFFKWLKVEVTLPDEERQET